MQRGVVKDVLQDGTAIIHAKIPVDVFVHRQVKEVYVELIDSRKLSDRQRRACYAFIKAIADWSGSSTQEVKEAFKLEFWADRVDTLADKIFSLSDAPMSLVAEFQRFLVDFILRENVPVKFPLIGFVDDINHYTYACLINKKCTVCGRSHADFHHLDAIGMGSDRRDVSHLGREVMSLCREHHEEFHTLGRRDFMEKYHLDGGIIVDKTILKIYGLKG